MPASGGTNTPHLLCSERIKVDKPRIVMLESGIELSAAMNLHQNPHTPCVQVVRMLIPQRDWKQHFGQLDLRKRRDLVYLTTLPPKQRIQRVNQLALYLSRWRPL